MRHWVRVKAAGGAICLLAAAGCGAGRGLSSPIREVDGTRYFTVETKCQRTASFDFTLKLCRLSASSQLAMARASEVYARLDQEQRAQVEELVSRRGGGRDAIAGPIAFVDQLVSRAELRDVRELKREEQKEIMLMVLGIPWDTWQELVDEAAAEVAARLRAGQR